jgi:hypothetical protein
MMTPYIGSLVLQYYDSIVIPLVDLDFHIGASAYGLDRGERPTQPNCLETSLHIEEQH